MSPASLEQGEGGHRKPALPALRQRDEHLESLKIMVGHIAHDLNNCLSPILGYVSMIREEAGQQTNIQTYATALDRVVRKVGKNIEDLLLATRPHRRFNPESFNFHELLPTAIDEWKNAAPQKDHIQVESRLEPCRLWGDAAQWRQVCSHLLNNAALAMTAGGKLAITLKAVSLSSEEMNRLGLSSSTACLLTIKDTGPGMNEQVLARAFDPFFTTRAKNQAQGLGLTIVHSVTYLHGGQVILESGPETGTLVSIWLPAKPIGITGPA